MANPDEDRILSRLMTLLRAVLRPGDTVLAAAETYGRTEEIIGEWLSSRGGRDRLQIATKASGPNGGHSRGGKGFEPTNIAQAVDDSLRRLKTDHR